MRLKPYSRVRNSPPFLQVRPGRAGRMLSRHDVAHLEGRLFPHLLRDRFPAFPMRVSPFP